MHCSYLMLFFLCSWLCPLILAVELYIQLFRQIFYTLELLFLSTNQETVFMIEHTCKTRPCYSLPVLPSSPCFSLYLAIHLRLYQIGRYPICQFLCSIKWTFAVGTVLSHGKVLIPLLSKTFFLSCSPSPQNAGAPGLPCQVYKGCWCTAPVLLSNVNLVHDGAQMHRYFYQFIRKKVITMWRQVTPSLRYSSQPAA